MSSSREYASALGYFVVSSVGMMLGNKVAVNVLPLPSTLMLIQIFGTLLLLAFSGQIREGLKWNVVKRWIPTAFLFSMMIFTSATSFLHASVSSVLIFRNVSAIMTTFAEYFTRGTKTTWEIVASETVIVIGAAVYGWNSVSFTLVGLFWMLLNVFCQVMYGIYLKREMDLNPALKKMSKYQMSLYNNVLAIVPIGVMLFAWGEHERLHILSDISGTGWSVILATCFLGFFISTSGLGLQRLVSASTFIVVNNLAKFLNICLGMIFLKENFSSLSDWSGCVLAFAGGFWYSFATSRAVEKKKTN